MLTYPLTATTIYRVGRMRNDDGDPADPWSLPEWRYGPFNGRFADPEDDPQYRVRYVALETYGAFVESLQVYRPDLSFLEAVNAVEFSSEPTLEPVVPPVYYERYALARAELVIPGDGGLLDLVTGEGMARAHAVIGAAARRSRQTIADYDASTLLSATSREFTQALSRVVFEYGEFNGIAYRSRFDVDAICLALFEGTHDLREPTYDPIDTASPEFGKACAIHHLPIPKGATDAETVQCTEEPS